MTNRLASKISALPVGDGTRDRILAAAIQMFSRIGYEGVSIRELERSAGVNRGLVAYHFNSKETLWKAVIAWMMERFHEEFTPYRQLFSDMNPRERERLLRTVYVRFSAKHPEFFRILLLEGGRDSSLAEWLVREHIRPSVDFFAKMANHRLDYSSTEEAIGYFSFLGAASTASALQGISHAMFGVDSTSAGFVDALAAEVASNSSFLARRGGTEPTETS